MWVELVKVHGGPQNLKPTGPCFQANSAKVGKSKQYLNTF